MTNIYSSTPRQVRKFVERCFNAGLPPFVKSSPGIGKSAIMKQLAKDYNLELIDIRLSMCDPTDLNGLPCFNEKTGKAEFRPFDMFPVKGTPLPPGKNGWLMFFDEFNSAPKSIQAASYKIMLDHMVGGLPVVDESGKLVGIISDHDVFKALVDITGARLGGLQFAVELPDQPGTARPLFDLLRAHNARLLSVLTVSNADATRHMYIRVRDLENAQAEQELMDGVNKIGKVLYSQH